MGQWNPERPDNLSKVTQLCELKQSDARVYMIKLQWAASPSCTYFYFAFHVVLCFLCFLFVFQAKLWTLKEGIIFYYDT